MSLYVTRTARPPREVWPATRRWSRRLVRLALVAVVLGCALAVLAVEAYTHAAFAPDAHQATDPPNDTVPAAVRDGGPVIDLTGARPRTVHIPAREIVLTFDDGPDPQWTPKVLDVLAKYHVPGTFFVIGSQVARHPELARRAAAEGHELGVHTFTHPDLARIPGWWQRAEYAETQLAVAYAAGVKTSLLRPPYSSTADAVSDRDWPVLTGAGRQGYVTVLNDTDSEDWARPGVGKVVENATPTTGHGAIVLMHDAGGDRGQTVAALDRFIPEMLAEGYTFKTVSQALNSAMPGNERAATVDRWRGGVVVYTIQAADLLMRVLWVLLLLIGALTLMRTLMLFTVALRHHRNRRAAGFSWGPPVTEPVSVIVPAHDEEETIEATLRTLRASDYAGDLEIVVVDDGSADATADRVRELDLPGVRLVSVPQGGKAAALAAGVALAAHDLIVMIDADTIVRPDAVRKLVQPFADPGVGGVAGNVKVGNRTTIIGRWQHLEYVIGFNLDRRLYDSLGCIPTVPGALGAFRRQALTDAGGPPLDTLAEDTDLTMAVLRAGWRVVYEQSAQSITEAPATLRQLWRQRYRWSYGTMQSMWKHRHAVVESGASGRFGRQGLPLIALFSVVLPMFGPILDIMALYGVLFLDRTVTLAGWLAVLVLQAVTAVLAFRLDRESLRPLWTLPLQQLAYRQIMYLVLLRSVTTAISGRRLPWHNLQRSGEVARSAS